MTELFPIRIDEQISESPWTQEIVARYQQGESAQIIFHRLRTLIAKQNPEYPYLTVKQIVDVVKAAGAWREPGSRPPPERWEPFTPAEMNPQLVEGADFTRYTGFLAKWARDFVVFYRQGKSPIEIAQWWRQTVGRVNIGGHDYYADHDHIKYVLRRVGVMAGPPPSPILQTERQAEALRLYEEKLTLRQIAERMGVSSSRASRLVERAKEWRRRAKRREEGERRIDELFPPPASNGPLPRILGRPIDMGGPREVWLEQGPWDER